MSMIKCDNEGITINGIGKEILADFGCISKALMEEFGMVDVMQVFFYVCHKHMEEEEKKITCFLACFHQ